MIEQQFIENCNKYIGENYSRKTYLLAVSGGVDSMVLAHMFLQNKLQFSVAHCNFKLRGKDSDNDELMVRNFCEKHNIPFYCEHFETGKYAKEQGVSIQMAARDLRYNFFNKLLNDKKIDFLVTAHHAGDQAETILLNLIRGTGIEGLKGMLFLQNKTFRPLLNISKKHITSFAKEKNIVWREDASNASTKYKRNAVRLNIIPEIEKLNPSFTENISDFAKKMLDTQTIYFNKIKEEKEVFFSEKDNRFYIDKSFSGKLKSPLQYLFEWIKPFGFNYVQATEILSSINKVGKVFYSEKYMLNIDREFLILSTLENTVLNKQFFNLDELINTEEFNGEVIEKKEITSFSNDTNHAYFDYDKIQFPLTLRTWQKGDKFMPFGMKGMKKLSDFFVDVKIPVSEKNNIPVLINGNGDIMWVCGYRADERYKISDKTKKVLLLKLHN